MSTDPPVRQAPSATVDAEAAASALFEASSHAWAAGDADRFVRGYAEDATVGLPGTFLQGKGSIRAAMRDAFAGPLKGSRRIHAVQSIRSVGSRVTIVVTRSATALAGEAEPHAARWELATWTLSRHGDRWLVEAYHSCPAPDRNRPAENRPAEGESR
ncbi:SgcJ/EcaC family oxidoreductase [Actinocatenispora comari]|jgi:uncharacterized protein (TIGR02246 family)|uniref:DUF4440 domain-containing protein n=1 Tax=Actinocatenispora comari TaxID=2807577 RepID=A0A8J4AGM4_9ACTN|nr:SgcJ/EcaC family oxidoreductase [Actinocatenispora comari]GIL29195.1 hypothetical protein NUM_44490 [Actinocatenispora comari]GIL31850.1 hypothetical protein NUM_71040 [Actinocatenispora comari]